MPFRPKTKPELLSDARARFRKLQGLEPDFNVGSWLDSMFEAMTESQAEIYVQLSLIPKIFSILTSRGDDLDRRALDLGTFFRTNLRRLQARPSVAKVSFGDGTQIASSRLVADVDKADSTFEIGVSEADDFPTSGAVVLERGTAREERIVYTRAGTTLTRVWPTASFAYPHAAYGEVARVATQSAIASLVSIGGTSVTLSTGTGASWPTSGSVVLDRGTSSQELRTFTRSGDVLTLGMGTTFAHAVDGTAILSTYGSDRAISLGTQVYAPATESSKQVTFETLLATTLRDGDFWSSLVDAQCLAVGSDTNVGSGVISKISASPFSGAVVSNPLPAAGGRNRELDDEYALRLVNFVAAWGGRSAHSIEHFIVGLFDEISNSRVAFAQVVEPVLPTGTSLLYITDGSASFSVEREVFTGRDVIISDAANGNDRRGTLHAAAPFLVQGDGPLAERTPRLYASVQRGTSTSVGFSYLEDTTQNMVVDAYVGMFLKTADDQFWEITANSAIRFTLSSPGFPASGSYAVVDLDRSASAYISSTSTAVAANSLTDGSLALSVDEHAGHFLLDSDENLWPILSNTSDTFTLDAGGATPATGTYEVLLSERSLPLVLGTDFNFNEATGNLELLFEPEAHDALVASGDNVSSTVGAYTYAKGLAALAQRAVNGDPTDFADFPGARSHGVKTLVVAPTVVAPTLQISVLPKPRVSTASLFPLVQATVQSYVNSLGIGDEVIITEIIKRVKSLSGVADLAVVSPISNVAVADGQLARVTTASVFVF